MADELDVLLEHARTMIRDLRQERDLTQQQLADLVGWDKPRISKIERGDMPLTLVALAKLTPAFGKSLTEFLYDCVVRQHPHLPNTSVGRSARNITQAD